MNKPFDPQNECLKCKDLFRPDWKFCPNCGTKLPKYVYPPPKPEPKPKRVLNRPPWLVEMTSGLSDGYNWECLYEGKTWALIRVPGGMYWAGLGMRAYGKSHYDVVLKGARRFGRGMGPVGVHLDAVGSRGLHTHEYWPKGAVAGFTVHQGRIDRKTIDKYKNEVDLLDRYRP